MVGRVSPLRAAFGKTLPRRARSDAPTFNSPRLPHDGVQYKTDLNPAAPWTDVSGDVTATGTTASKTDVVPDNAPQRFYRVEMFR